MFAYLDSAIRFIQTFLLTVPVSWGYQTQWEYYTRLPPNWIISFLEAYKELMHCFVVFPFFLKYLMHAEYMISSWPVVLKSTLMIPKVVSHRKI